MVKLFFMVVYYSLLRWFVQSDIVDCINSCSRLYSPLPESVVVNFMLIYQNYFCIYNYFIFKTLTILQT